MNVILDDHDTSVVTPVHDEGVSVVEDDVVPVAEIEGHQGIATLDSPRESREVVAELEDRILGDHVEVMLTVDDA